MTFSKIQKKTLELLLKKYEASKTYNESNEITQSFLYRLKKSFQTTQTILRMLIKSMILRMTWKPLKKLNLLQFSRKMTELIR